MQEQKHTEQVNTRVPFGLLKEMDKLIVAGRYRDRGDFTLAAIRYYIDNVVGGKE